MAKRKATKRTAAKRTLVKPDRISALRHYKLSGFSVEGVMNLLTALDREIVIRRKPRSRKAGRISVVAA